MTGITQTSQRPGHPARPLHGRRTYEDEEKLIQSILDAAQIEREVEVFWGQRSPEQIAEHIRSRRGMHRVKWITARWVEGIKRRIDNRRRQE